MNQKTDSVGRYIKNLDAFTTALKDEEAKLAQRRKTAEKKLDYLKKIKAYWFNILSVQALYDVLGTIISVPNTLKPKPPRKDF